MKRTMKTMEKDARAITMYYYAYLNDQDVVEMVMGLPSQITDPHYISIDSDDQSLVGKWYNRETGQFEDVMFFYAVLNDQDIVTDVIALPSQITDEKKILVSSLDQSLVGKWYNRETGEFTEVPIHILAKMNTGEINTLKADGSPEDKWLHTELMELRKELEEAKLGGFGGYKAKFRIKDNQEITEKWMRGGSNDGKNYSVSFNTSIPGYFPKMVRIVGRLLSDSVLVADFYITRNFDGSIKEAYVDKYYVGIPREHAGAPSENHMVINMNFTDDVFSAGYISGKYYDEGAGCFMQQMNQMDKGIVDITDISYNENSFSFKMYTTSEIVGMYTSMNLYGYVY